MLQSEGAILLFGKAQQISATYLRAKDHIDKLAMTQLKKSFNYFIKPRMIPSSTKGYNVLLVFDPSVFVLADLISVLHKLPDAPMLTIGWLFEGHHFMSCSEDLHCKVQPSSKRTQDIILYHMSNRSPRFRLEVHYALWLGYRAVSGSIVHRCLRLVLCSQSAATGPLGI